MPFWPLMKWFSRSLNLKLSIDHFSTSIPFNLILIILNSLILTLYFIFNPNSIYIHNFTQFKCHQKSKILTLSSSTNHSLTRYTSLTMYTSLFLNLISIYIYKWNAIMNANVPIIRVRMWQSKWTKLCIKSRTNPNFRSQEHAHNENYQNKPNLISKFTTQIWIKIQKFFF